MTTKPLAAVLVAPGTNRDSDVALALQLSGAETIILSILDLEKSPSRLMDADIIVIAGGFSYADALGSGQLFALELEAHVGADLRQAILDKRPILGICNGFQTLVRMGLLSSQHGRLALGHNDGGVFDCRWVELQPTSTQCIWTAGLQENIACPIAHGEGKFVGDAPALADLMQNDRVALRYVSGNPNGSLDNIAGICDESGVVLGLMPHPENHVVARQHPRYLRGSQSGLGLPLFRNGVQYARR